jgi:hypothetical protein
METTYVRNVYKCYVAYGLFRPRASPFAVSYRLNAALLIQRNQRM